MQTLKQPYEVLVRWDQDGRLQGAQVQYRYVIKDSDQIVGESVSGPEPVTVGVDFPLSDIMTQVGSDALAEITRLKRDAEQAQQAASATMQEQATEIARLTAQGQHQATEITRLNREAEQAQQAANATILRQAAEVARLTALQPA